MTTGEMVVNLKRDPCGAISGVIGLRIIEVTPGGQRLAFQGP